MLAAFESKAEVLLDRYFTGAMDKGTTIESFKKLFDIAYSEGRKDSTVPLE